MFCPSMRSSAAMQRKQVSGVVVAIIHHNGPAEFHCYGVTDAKTVIPLPGYALCAGFAE